MHLGGFDLYRCFPLLSASKLAPPAHKAISHFSSVVPDMHFSVSLGTLGCALSFALGVSSEENKRDDQPSFDLYQGSDSQDSVYNDPASNLQYTLSSGNPSVIL